jgi:hypothetical protein
MPGPAYFPLFPLIMCRYLRTIMACRLLLLSILLLPWLNHTSRADGLADNIDSQVRPIPPVGLELSPAVTAELAASLAAIEASIPQMAVASSAVDWWNDVRVIARGVRLTLEGRQFYKPAEIDHARRLMELARSRIAELAQRAADEKTPPSWARQSGRLILGHRSKLDDTVQPMGVFLPTGYETDPHQPRRLDIWLHGRDESVSEVAFLYRRWTQDSPYQPTDTIVLQPWGRYSNAFRFAGEVDVLEAIEEVARRYAIDRQKIAIRGFSMGGAGCWNLAVHHADRFFAANPGAGFCETERFLTGFQGESLKPSLVQRQLWNLYDCPPLARNLSNLPTVAYSGGLDRQKEAADIMTAAAAEVGVYIPYIVHPGSAHAIHPDAKEEIEALMEVYAKRSRAFIPPKVSWSTYSLRHADAYWIHLRRLRRHWEKATIEAGFNEEWSKLTVATQNITSFDIKIPADRRPATFGKSVAIVVDEQPIGVVAVKPTAIFALRCHLSEGRWSLTLDPTAETIAASSDELEKRPGLQGPIDDAFMDRFIIARPSGQEPSPQVQAWTQRELQHAIEHWRRQFRGEPLVKIDTEITDEDAQSANIICFGTPRSNRYLAACLPELPLAWDQESLVFRGVAYASATHVPICVYPNPKARHRYLVLNSGFTYREYDYLNNARQTPKLGDWAIVDATTPMTTRGPGHVVAEGFFDDRWN